MNEEKKLNADDYIFRKDEKPVFRSMIVPDKVIKDDTVSENKV